MAGHWPHSCPCLGGVVTLSAVIITVVVGARHDSTAFTIRQEPTVSVSTLRPSQPPTVDRVSGERCWQRIQQVYVYESYAHLLSDCEVCCGDVEIKANQLDWIRLTTSGNETVKRLLKVPEIRSRLSQDIFWLTSSRSDVLMYMGNASDVVVTWDYLATGQKVLEVVILSAVFAALVVTLLGNILVVATMVSRANKVNAWQIVRTFLAITDLLRGVFVMILTMHNTLRLMTSPLAHLELNTLTYVPWIYGTMNEPMIIQSGYSSFCAIMYDITSVMSIQCLSWLALERLLMCKYHGGKTFLTLHRLGGVVLVMWLIAIAFPLVKFLGGESGSFFDPVSKLTFLVSTEEKFGVAQTAFLVQSAYLTFLFLFTVVASVEAMRTFHIRSREELIELTKHSPITQVKQQKMDDRHIMRTMKLILIAYLASVGPQFLLLIPNLTTQVRFVVNWMYVLSSSWNWYLYNMRSNCFKNHLARLVLLSPWLPVALELKLRAIIEHTCALNPDWGPIWYKLDNLIKRKSSQFQKLDRPNSSDTSV
ncbi:uncharacterized protein [Panulirus ornatus]|uniref:uncharacterized protein n=1 Tax=Panulirus ornatus TaxID=150431 RepID=UPI003A85AC90